LYFSPGIYIKISVSQKAIFTNRPKPILEQILVEHWRRFGRECLYHLQVLRYLSWCFRINLL